MIFKKKKINSLLKYRDRVPVRYRTYVLHHFLPRYLIDKIFKCYFVNVKDQTEGPEKAGEHSNEYEHSLHPRGWLELPDLR